MTQRFYQVVGYQGHFRPYFWKPQRDFGDNHEFAQEPHAIEAIAGPKSGLWVRQDPQGNEVQPFIELVMGVRPHGAISILIPENHFDHHIKPAMGWTHRSNSCPDPYPRTMYASLSPIRFESPKELADMLKDLRPAKAGMKGCDDSKLNKYLKEGELKPERGAFEQARLLWHILYGGRAELPGVYGLPSPPSPLRLVYFSVTHWIDPHTYDISANEEPQVLDFGWYEPSIDATKPDTAKHYIIEEYAGMSKGSLNRSDFAHGESTTIPESNIPDTLRTFFSEPGSYPIVLVTHDWARTSRFLSSQGINTSVPTWHLGVGKLLGFERQPIPSGPRADRRPSESNSSNRRRGSNGQYIDPDSKPVGEFEHDIKEEEGKPGRAYNGRWDPSSSSPYGERERDRRSLSPRSRTRPLNRREDRHHKPIFRPDEEEEDGEIVELAPMPDVHVIDIRELFITLAITRRPFILYPPMANRLGLQVEGWCAGNWARQFSEILASLVGGSPIHRRIEEFKRTPGVVPQSKQTGVPTILEGIAGGAKEEVKAAWGDSSEEEDDD
ncbi:unnamed protein product [Rhizoctonia solani]|uniref:Uncharacterized protein n=1 Tax=Rhizoctonia solani TaxID=456999 RepID=A0A8H3GB06_9AGAM|nr:unnamed protein product [Rhizoctonia solani]